MLRAGEALYQHLRAQFAEARCYGIFCGAGNNAGDGYVLAHLLKEAGLQVIVYTLIEATHLKGEALQAYTAYSTQGGQVHNYHGQPLAAVDVWIDALLGIGLTREVSGLYWSAIAALNQMPQPIVAIDIPSGIHADTGKAMPIAVRAAYTLTFIGLKQGLLTGDAPEYCGELALATLDTSATIYTQIRTTITRLCYQPLPKRHRCTHKGHFGHVLVIGGAAGFSGAVLLAAEAALRVGSGLVSIATRAEHAAVLNILRPEIMCHAVNETQQLIALIHKASVIAIGPGLGQSPWAQALFAQAILSDKPLIIDADALNLLAQAPRTTPLTTCIITPHPGEAGRLLKQTTANIQQDRYASVQNLQQQYGGVVVLKGAGTLIADSQGIAVASVGNPGMASGGMGDVLTGVIAGLLAQGLPLNSAAQQGVMLHGLAADQAALESGERGLLASDLMPYLRRMVN